METVPKGSKSFTLGQNGENQRESRKLPGVPTRGLTTPEFPGKAKNTARKLEGDGRVAQGVRRHNSLTVSATKLKRELAMLTTAESNSDNESPKTRRSASYASPMEHGVGPEDSPPATVLRARQLAAFVPKYTLRMASRAAEEGSSLGPRKESCRCLMAFCDVSGFTRLTETLSEGAGRSMSGAELARDAVSDYFGQIIDGLTDVGGDVAKLAGDAVVVVWLLRAEEVEELGQEGTERHFRKSARTVAAKLSQITSKLDRRKVEGTDLELQLHSALTFGELTVYYVGGVENVWLQVPEGAALRQVQPALDQASPGKVVCSQEAWGLLRNDVTGVPLGEGCVEVSQDFAGENDELKQPSPCSGVEEQAAIVGEERLEGLVPVPVALAVKTSGPQASAELRRVTIAFVHLEPPGHERALTEMQKLAVTLQEECQNRGGLVKELTVDDKGMVLVTVFGYPSSQDTHRTAAVQAVNMALVLRQMAGCPNETGITTGDAFCGTVGNERRSEYSIVGPSVILAARLMSHAAHSQSAILVDNTTASLGTGAAGVSFAPMGQVKVKGRDSFVPTFTPAPTKTGVQSDRSASYGGTDGGVRSSFRRPRELARYVDKNEGEQTAGEQGGVVWMSSASNEVATLDHHERVRRSQHNQVVERLRRVQKRGRGKGRGADVLLIEGMAGTGKTDIVETAVKDASGMRFAVASANGSGNSEQSADPAHSCFFTILQVLTEEASIGDVALPTTIERTKDLLAVIGTIFSAGPSMPSEVRRSLRRRKESIAEEIARVLGAVVQAIVSQSPVLIALDSVEGLPEVTWKVVHYLASELPARSCLLVATRPSRLNADMSSNLISMINRSSRRGRHVVVGGMPGEQVGELLEKMMKKVGARGVEESVVDFISERSQGNPFLAVSLARSAYVSGTIGMDANRVIVANTYSSLASSPIPSDVRAVLLQHRDFLPPQLVNVMRVASVVGQASLPLMQRLLPSHQSAYEIEAALQYLTSAGFFVPVQDASPLGATVLEATGAGTSQIGYQYRYRRRRGSIINPSIISACNGVIPMHMVYSRRSCLFQDVVKSSWGLRQRADIHKRIAKAARSLAKANGPPTKEGKPADMEESLVEWAGSCSGSQCYIRGAACRAIALLHLVEAEDNAEVRAEFATALEEGISVQDMVALCVTEVRHRFGDDRFAAKPREWLECHLALVPELRPILSLQEASGLSPSSRAPRTSASGFLGAPLPSLPR